MQHIWTEEEKAYLKEVTPGHHHKEIQELMNQKFGTNFTVVQIKSALARYNLNTGFTGQFKEGHRTWNKGKKGCGGWEPTQFKKGHMPANYKPVGSERVNVDGYTEVKVADPRKWKLKHRIIWEEHYGKIPKGYAVIFGDSNKLNLDIKNLLLVSRKQILILNNQNLIQNDAELTRVGITVADVLSKMNERRKEVK